jgi:8-oxo-dGTP pyrophosphatase MutT (NUDIX family)
MSTEKDLYFVAVKIFLEDEKGNFLITKDRFGDWDIPGGRLRQNDFDASLDDVVKRKISEELGPDISYTMGDPIVFMRHERNEILASGERQPRRIFAIGYETIYKGGAVKLGSNHTEYKWVSVSDFKPEEFFSGGWLKGVKEYMALKTK